MVPRDITLQMTLAQDISVSDKEQIVPFIVCIHMKHIKFHFINLTVIIVLNTRSHHRAKHSGIFLLVFFVMQMKAYDLITSFNWS